MKINIDEAKEIIRQLNLKPIMGIWHYSFNFEPFYDQMNFDDGEIFADRPINQWSPRPIFTYKKIDRTGKIPGKNPFWLCELTAFDAFLKRRDGLSKRRSHFPTTKSFARKDHLLKGKLVTKDFDQDYFIAVYGHLLKPGHMIGVDLVNNLFENNKGLPASWLKTIELEKDGIKAIGLIIDDGKSNSLFNLASVLDKNSWGLYMLALWFRDCCNRGVKFVDCGISGTYGYYKDAFFLDAIGNI